MTQTSRRPGGGLGDVAGSLHRLVAALDARLDASPVLSHLLWREADTPDALAARFRWIVDEIRARMRAALPDSRRGADVHSAAELLALAVSYRRAPPPGTPEKGPSCRRWWRCTASSTSSPKP